VKDKVDRRCNLTEWWMERRDRDKGDQHMREEEEEEEEDGSCQ